MKLLPILGNNLCLDGGAMFGHVPKTLWEQWIVPDDKNRIPLATRALLVQTDNLKNFLFEAAVGVFFEPKLKMRYGIHPEEDLLLKHLKEAGVSPEEIDGVILSHLHFDHAGGLLAPWGEKQQLNFPNATYYVSRAHWEYAQSPHPREKASFVPLIAELLKSSGRLSFVDGAEHPDLDFGVKFLFSNGHTVGLMLSLMTTDKGPLIFVSDLIPGVSWVHLPVVMGYDRFAELKVSEKEELYREFIDEAPRLFFTHDPKVSSGVLQKDERGRFCVVPDIVWPFGEESAALPLDIDT